MVLGPFKLPRGTISLVLFAASFFLFLVSLRTSCSLLDRVFKLEEEADELKAQFIGSNGNSERALRRSNAVVNVQQKTPAKKFTKVPEGHEKTFYYDGKPISRPAVRALRRHGWRQVDDEEDAHMIFFYSSKPHDLKPWQRFNHIPDSHFWNSKDWFVEVFKEHTDKTGVVPYFLPESFLLEEAKERKAFKKRITEEGGSDHPWVLKEPTVNQGKGIEIIAPNSDRLVEVANFKKKDAKDFVMQQYICNELTWRQRKFDVRMFWYVASVDPLIVLYQDGYARIGNGVYSEESFDNTVSHLTTHTGLGEEGKESFDDFCKHIVKHSQTSPDASHIRDPVQHVRDQFKDSLAEFAAAFKDKSFSPSKKQLNGAENGFGFYGADFILDNDLDVWLIEPQMGCGLDEDYDFRIEMHDRLFRGMVDTFEEVWSKQEAGKPVLPLQDTGEWEVIYADGWQYKYEGYERTKNKKGCSPIASKPKKS